MSGARPAPWELGVAASAALKNDATVGGNKAKVTNYGQLSSNAQIAAGNSAGERFGYIKTGPVYHDKWATVLFIAHFFVFIVLSGMGLSHMSQHGLDPAEEDNSTDTSNQSAAGSTQPSPYPEHAATTMFWILGLSALLGAALSGGYVYLMHHQGKHLIKLTFAFALIFYGVSMVMMVLSGAWLGAFLYAVAAVFTVLCYKWWQGRFPLAALIMETVCDITKTYPATYSVAAMNLVIQLVYTVWWAATVLGVQARFGNQSSLGTQKLLTFFLLFSFYWTSQILKNTLHVTIAGVVSSYYFLNGTPAMPENPTVGAAKRAFTSSFGPIAFGSLIVAIIKLIRTWLRNASRRAPLASCIIDCFMGCIEGLVQYFNTYAYIHVAIYGKSFCDAGKDTWNLIKSHGVDVIINDNLVSSVLNMGMWCVGLACGMFAWIIGFTVYHGDTWNLMSGVTSLVAVGAWLIGMSMMTVVTMVIDSGTSTTFVCIAEDPAALARTKPELYRKFTEVYPQIAWRV